MAGRGLYRIDTISPTWTGKPPYIGRWKFSKIGRKFSTIYGSPPHPVFILRVVGGRVGYFKVRTA